MTGAHRAAMITALVTIVFAFGATASTGALFLQTSKLIVDVADPRLAQQIAVADVSQRISSRLVLTACTATGMTLLLATAVIVSTLLGRVREPHPSFGRVMIVAALLAVIGCGLSISVHRSWAARLHETALTGSFPR